MWKPGLPFFAALFAVSTACLGSSLGASEELPWELADQGWRTDDAWYDGQAEVATYAAVRVIYGRERIYEARAYTNKQVMDPSTTTKSGGGDGVEVFKHHWSERAPTERYDYDFSTASFVRSEDLRTYKVTASTQEDCGASFKQLWEDGGGWNGLESVYFPDGGTDTFRRNGAMPMPEDALTLVLRDLARAAEAGDGLLEPLEFQMLPSQRDTHRVPFDPVDVRVRHLGPETVQVPAGSIACHAFTLESDGGDERARFWFAADGGAPLLHALVRYEGADGLRFELTDLQRYPYWARGPR